MQQTIELFAPLWGVWHNSIPANEREQLLDRKNQTAGSDNKNSSATPTKPERSWSGLYRAIDLAG